MTLGNIKSRINRLERAPGAGQPAMVVLHETTKPENYPGGITVTPEDSTDDVLKRLGYDPAKTLVLRLNFGD